MTTRPGGPGKTPAGGQDAPSTSYGQSGEFFLSNYRLGKTLGIGSFGKVRAAGVGQVFVNDQRLTSGYVQVKIAEHVQTGHKVAIKILNCRKIKQQDMEEKGVSGVCSKLQPKSAAADAPW